MKDLVSGPLGSDGSYDLKVEDGQLKATIGYKVEALLAPVKAHFVDQLKKVIPGDWDDKLIDDAWAGAVKLLSE